MKNEAAADEEGEGEVLVVVVTAATGAGSPGWLELLSWQGVKVLLLLLVVMAVMVLTGASEAVSSLSASPVKPWAC